jgi:hypothetical protein
MTFSYPINDSDYDIIFKALEDAPEDQKEAKLKELLKDYDGIDKDEIIMSLSEQIAMGDFE